MAGYSVDPEALEGAIKELEDIQSDVTTLVRQSAQVQPGELTAQDSYTNRARQIIQDRATGEQGSLSTSAKQLSDKLDEKIQAYKQTLQEYRESDQSAAEDAGRIDSRA